METKQYEIILLTGKAGSGKDTVADYLMSLSEVCEAGKHPELYPPDTVFCSEQIFSKDFFANPLKKMACILIGADENDDLKKYIYDNAFKEAIIPFGPMKGFTGRTILQKLGTEQIRNGFYEDVWVNHLAFRLSNRKCGKYVVSDCRFDNEANLPIYLEKFLTELSNLKNVQVKCVVVEVIGRGGLSGEYAKHKSESGLSVPREYLDNSGTKEQLYRNIDQLLKKIGM